MPTANEDIIDALCAQHQQIKVQFAHVESASGEHKEQLFADLVGLLAVHESVEESLVHPLARRKLDGGDAVVDSRLAEEQEARAALADLYDLSIDHPEFNTQLVASGTRSPPTPKRRRTSNSAGSEESDRLEAPATKPMAGALDGVVFLGEDAKGAEAFVEEFIAAITQHRHYDRPVDGIAA